MRPALSHLGDKGLLLLLRSNSFYQTYFYYCTFMHWFIIQIFFILTDLLSCLVQVSVDPERLHLPEWKRLRKQTAGDLAEGKCVKPPVLSSWFHIYFCLKRIHLRSQEYNLKYVDMIEEQLNEALTTYRKPVDGDNYVRRSNQRFANHMMTMLTKMFKPDYFSLYLIFMSGYRGQMSFFRFICTGSWFMIKPAVFC